MKCLVTGCAGFIGSHLTEALLRLGREVVGVDAFTPTYDAVYKTRNLKTAREHPGFRLLNLDIARDDLEPALEGVEIVFHLAGEPGVRSSWGEQFAAYTRNNVLATERLLNACVDRPIRRFVFAGSSSVYGNASQLPWREDACPQPYSPYAITKLAAEHLCRAYHANFEAPTVILRYFTVYGPRQRPDMAFHRFFRAILEARPIPIFGNGRQSRDFTFVDDIVAGTLAAAEAPNVEGETFNLGGGSRITLNDLLALLEQVVGRSIAIERQEVQAGDVRHTWADTTRAARKLGYRPQVSLREGLAREYAWMQEMLSA